ncbi:anaphase-promoting complex subunit 12 [Biomphalaria glabrata]|nr:anaphase-promoting complex subunit 12 [Biomphalaria glabrata]
MIRRKPTRIELKIADIEEYDAIKKEREAAAKSSKAETDTSPEVLNAKKRMETIHARIGYDPKPVYQPH